MQIVISGPAGTEGLPAGIRAWLQAGQASWLAPEDVLASRWPQGRRAPDKVVWLYVPPWDSVREGGPGLADWLRLQRGALRARASRLDGWALVNADGLVCSHLARWLGFETQPGLQADSATAPVAMTDQQLMGAKLLQWLAPEAWDAFEALEAAAWTRSDAPRIPLLREQLVTPGIDALDTLLRQLDTTAALQAREAAFETRQAATDALDARLRQAWGENERLLLELHQLQEELERVTVQNRVNEDQARKAIAQAEAAAAAAAAAALEQRESAQRSAEAAAAAAFAREQEALDLQLRLRGSREESDQLLQQLQQVQEELERVFLEGRQTQDELADVDRRLARLHQRYPHAVDVGTVAIAKAQASSAQPEVLWSITELGASKRIWSDLQLRTFLAPGGHPGVELAGAASSGGPLVPALLAHRDKLQLERFRAMRASTWLALGCAVTAVEQALREPAALQLALPADFDLGFWRQALLPLAAQVRALPPVFRHEGVRLHREQIHPDYEHLWLVFEQAGFGAQALPGFQLRLAAAGVRPGKFSSQPKLEIPLATDDRPPFKGWFEESRDPLGPKLELRADLERGAFDLNVWSRLPREARGVLASVIASLPAALRELELRGQRLARPWSQWQQLVAGLMEVMRSRLATPGATTAPTAAQESSPSEPTPRASRKKPSQEAAAPEPAARPASPRRAVVPPAPSKRAAPEAASSKASVAKPAARKAPGKSTAGKSRQG